MKQLQNIIKVDDIISWKQNNPFVNINSMTVTPDNQYLVAFTVLDHKLNRHYRDNAEIYNNLRFIAENSDVDSLKHNHFTLLDGYHTVNTGITLIMELEHRDKDIISQTLIKHTSNLNKYIKSHLNLLYEPGSQANIVIPSTINKPNKVQTEYLKLFANVTQSVESLCKIIDKEQNKMIDDYTQNR